MDKLLMEQLEEEEAEQAKRRKDAEYTVFVALN